MSQVDTLYPCHDTHLSQPLGSAPQGGQINLLINPWTPTWTSRSAIAFDLSPYTGCIIDSAWLILSQRNTLGTSRTMNIHRITTPWSEASAIWYHPWTTLGGDYDPAIEGSLTPVWTGTLRKDSVNLTATVQGVVNGTYSNLGWLLKIASEDATQQFWEYYSKEWPTVSERPILKIAFSGCALSPSTGCTPVTLPVELVDLDAKVHKDEVLIEWTTLSEISNDYFTVERSRDGINFEIIGELDGAGTNTSAQQYSWTDESPLIGNSYYRLSQTDFDGTVVQFEVRSVNCKFDKVSIYPNPIKGNFTLVSKSRGTITLVDNSGKLILEQEFMAEENTILLDSIASGVYTAFITLNNGRREIHKLIML